MSILLSSRDWVWLDFSFVVPVGFAFGTCLLGLVDSILFWFERVGVGHGAMDMGRGGVMDE